MVASDAYKIIMQAKYIPLVNILEVLPKNKKAKEEKTAVLGQASLDLLPVLMGETNNSTLTLSLHTVKEGVGASPGDGNDAVSTVMTDFCQTYVACTLILCRMLRLILR